MHLGKEEKGKRNFTKDYHKDNFDQLGTLGRGEGTSERKTVAR